MAKFELNIYGEDDAIVKQYATSVCPWGVYLQAVDLSESLEGRPVNEHFEAIGSVLRSVFRGLTKEELMNADASDVMNTFEQVVSGGIKFKEGKIKNAMGAKG